MACSNRVIRYESIRGIGGQGTTVESVKCRIKQSSFDEKIAMCQFEAQLGLSSMVNDSCLFSTKNEHQCGRKA